MHGDQNLHMNTSGRVSARRMRTPMLNRRKRSRVSLLVPLVVMNPWLRIPPRIQILPEIVRIDGVVSMSLSLHQLPGNRHRNLRRLKLTRTVRTLKGRAEDTLLLGEKKPFSQAPLLDVQRACVILPVPDSHRGHIPLGQIPPTLVDTAAPVPKQTPKTLLPTKLQAQAIQRTAIHRSANGFPGVGFVPVRNTPSIVPRMSASRNLELRTEIRLLDGLICMCRFHS